jgi:arabinose-5-phosphate isomerase
VPLGATLAAAVLEMTGKGLGLTVVVDAGGAAAGIFTDGDLRRALERGRDLGATPVGDVMTATPATIAPDALAIDCFTLMEAPPRKTALLVLDEASRLVGAVHMHDLLRARVV